jgi:fumarate hydratase, class II
MAGNSGGLHLLYASTARIQATLAIFRLNFIDVEYCSGDNMMAQDRVRQEHDSLGEVMVPAEKYWGAQTQRALRHFQIGHEYFPRSFLRALGLAKLAAAQTNMNLQRLDPVRGKAIALAASRMVAGELDAHFPLTIWQSGSGTQTNMNTNEVLAYVANQQLGLSSGTPGAVHPNDHCNLGQSTNDLFPTAMHIAVVEQLHQQLFPALQRLQTELQGRVDEWDSIIKLGRTHLQDAIPLTLGQEFSAYVTQLVWGRSRLDATLPRLYPLAQGGTAVGTGLNTAREFATQFATCIVGLTGLPFTSAENKFAALSGHEPLVELSAMLATLAVSLNKMANDIRLLGSGPRSGLGELLLPANEPGSSIMPGKVNPTQCEVLTMVCAQVLGNHNTMSMAAAQGQLELNVFKPVIIYNLLQSIQLLSDGMGSFAEFCIAGLQPNLPRINELLERSLMLVTALSPRLGYEQAAALALSALNNGTSLREEVLKSGCLSMDELTQLLQPQNMLSAE